MVREDLLMKKDSVAKALMHKWNLSLLEILLIFI